jgi:hypothetical protein
MFAAYNADGVTLSVTANERIYSRYVGDSTSTCPSFRDPFDDAYASLNKAMIYAGAVAAQRNVSMQHDRFDPGWYEKHHTVQARVVGEHNVFRTDYWFFLGAVLVELVCIACILPTYWGWWKFGRSVSFSPLEVCQHTALFL